MKNDDSARLVKSLTCTVFAVVHLLASSYAQTGDKRIVIGVSVPSETIDLSFAGTGILQSVGVKEGQSVQAGAEIARLDSRILESQLRIATINAESQAAAKSAQANLSVRERRLQELERLAERGSANDNELARARADHAIALADLEKAHENSATDSLLAEQIAGEIEQRKLLSPIDGEVVTINFDAAEAITASSGPVATVVSLDVLHVIAYLENETAAGLRVGDQLTVISQSDSDLADRAEILFVSPVTDASSGTIRVKLRLENADRRHRSGVKYAIDLSDPE